uniref:Uncharacterized protein n=1 Tax=Arundo donax TaxID=35708 RepID=A0A0A9AEJ4_ARUDO
MMMGPTATTGTLCTTDSLPPTVTTAARRPALESLRCHCHNPRTHTRCRSTKAAATSM